MKQQEAITLLNQHGETLKKIVTEETKLIEKIAALEEVIGQQDNVSPELEEALKAVVDQGNVLDNVVPDEADIPDPVAPPVQANLNR